MNAEFDTFLRYHYGLLCRHCDKLVMDPDKSKGQKFLRGKCPTCGKHSEEPSFAVDMTKLTKKQRKALKKELKRQRKAEDRAALGKYASEA